MSELIINKDVEEFKKMHIELNVDLYKKLYLIRYSEEEIIKYYNENDMKTPMHMSQGSEAISAGVCHALRDTDQIFSTYRSHAAFLSKTQDTDFFFAEMYGKATSPLKGKGGSMHLCHPEKNFMGTSAIVASHIPVAIGAAYANKYNDIDRIVAVFFGDGATDEGVFWESMNIACLMKLPIVFICEDNDLAVHTSTTTRRGYDSIINIISKFNCYVFESESTDVEDIYHLTNQGLELIRGFGKDYYKPIFMNLKYYRYLEHVGINEDFDAGYRSKDEYLIWKEKDPIIVQRKKLLNLGISDREINNLEQGIENKVTDSIKNAKNAPYCDESELYSCVFANNEKN